MKEEEKVDIDLSSSDGFNSEEGKLNIDDSGVAPQMMA
jgi:hypothetical protein